MADKVSTLYSKIRKSEFVLVYLKGQRLLDENKIISAKFLLIPEKDQHRIKIAITVSSKAGKSVWRNRFRRLISSSLWLEKEKLKHIKDSLKSDLLIVLSPYKINQVNRKKTELAEIRNAVASIIMKINFSINNR